MNKKIKVLIVDDSPLVRQLINRILSSEKDIEVVGTALDGKYAIEKVKLLSPDVITLDIEMPNMDGLTFLEYLMKTRPLPCVMISATTSRGANNTIKALSLGAVDYILKPDNIVENIDKIRDIILSKVRIASHANLRNLRPSASRLFGKKISKSSDGIKKSNDKISISLTQSKSTISETKKYDKNNSLIAIGSSTGGTEAISYILSRLKNNLPPILITQHMPKHFTAAFSERLDRITDFTCVEAKNEMQLKKGHVYVAPGSYHVKVKKTINAGYILLSNAPAVNKHRPSADVMFKSISSEYKDRAVGIILTGMGRDGADGLSLMKGEGALTIAQDEESSVIFGMPKEAIKIGAATKVLSLRDITREIYQTFYF